MKKKADTFGFVMNTTLVFLLVAAALSWHPEVKPAHKKHGSVEAYLGDVPPDKPYTPPVVPRSSIPTEIQQTIKDRPVKASWGMYKVPVKINMSSTDLGCLARNIFAEAGREPYLGKMSVAQITYNRVKSGKWGKTFCQVVYAPRQFSWTNTDATLMKLPTGPNWKASIDAARAFRDGTRVAKLEGSNHYHATYVAPKWDKNMTQVAKVGQHVFYAGN